MSTRDASNPAGGRKKRSGKKGRGKGGRGRGEPRDYGAAVFANKAELTRLAGLKLTDKAEYHAALAKLRRAGVSIRGLNEALAPIVNAIKTEVRVGGGAGAAPQPPGHDGHDDHDDGLSRPADPSPGRMEVEVSHRNDLTNASAARALSRAKGLYQRGQLLTQIVRVPAAKSKVGAVEVGRPEGPVLCTIDAATLPGVITAVADFVRVGFTKEGEEQRKYVNPPGWCMADLVKRKHWHGVPGLSAVTGFPVVAPDGRVIAGDGYDPQTGVYVHGDHTDLAVPENPTREDARAAADALCDLVCDFPFALPSHRTGWVCAVLTPLARFAYRGPTPGFLLEANTSSAGKTLLADLVAQIVAGGDFARTTYPPEEAEVRKLVTSLVAAADPMVLFDNVSGRFGGPTIDAILTGTSYKDRLLGGNLFYDGPITTTFYVSANNPEIVGDLHRRLVPVRLEHPDEHPEDRDDFKYPLPRHARENRGLYLSAALTMLSAYLKAGRPRVADRDGKPLKPWGSFDGWAGVVRDAAVWAGLDDLHEARVALRAEANQETGTVRRLVHALAVAYPDGATFTCKQVITAAGPTVDSPGEGFTELAEILAGIDWGRAAAAKQYAPALGRLLRRYRRKNFGGLVVDHDPRGKGMDGQRWVVAAVPSRGSREKVGPDPSSLSSCPSSPEAPTTPRGGADRHAEDPWSSPSSFAASVIQETGFRPSNRSSHDDDDDGAVRGMGPPVSHDGGHDDWCAPSRNGTPGGIEEGEL